ncbi:MAG: hypothetical protein FJ119_12615 [Deltaproteobacteria bacterium]|nr:hypothetical protein [Deltaproteobacteria bacterium]
MPRSFLTPVIIALTTVFFAAGCASKNYTTTLRPSAGSLEGFEARFRINHVDAIPPMIFYMSGFTDSQYWAEKIEDAAGVDEFPHQLRDLLEAAFPERFTDEPEALPLDVRITVSDFTDTSTGSSILTSATWGVFGIILPLPIAMKYNCEVQVDIAELDLRQSVTFRNRLQAWISFPSPLALIPLPLAANRRAACMHPFQTRYYSGRLFTLESFGEAVIHAISACDPAVLNQAYRMRLEKRPD